MKGKLRALLVAIALATVLSFLAAFPTQSAPSQPRSGGTLTVGVLTEAFNLDAQLLPSTSDMPAAFQIYDTLLRYGLDLKIRPHLAESFEQVDPRTYRFRLRRGVRFHNGREVKGNDVRFSLLRAKDPNLRIFRRLVENIDDVKVLDEYAVEVTLKTPDQNFPHWVTVVQTAVVPREEVEGRGGGFSQRPVGTGPYKLVEWVKDSHIILEANPDYFMGRPLIDRVVIRTIPDPATMMLELENGKIDIAEQLFEDMYDRIAANRNLEIGAVPELNYRFLGLNQDDGSRGGKRVTPFKDLRVRQAIYHAVRWDEVFRSAAPKDVFGSRMYCHVPVVTPFYYQGCKALWPQPAYDPAKARRLLTEAGFPNGFKTSVLIWQKPFERLAIPIQADLRKVGIDMEILFLELAVWDQRVVSGDYDTYLARWAGQDIADPYGWLFLQFHSSQFGPPGNRARYVNPEADRLLAAARDSSGATRFQLFRQAQTILIRDIAQIPIQSTHAVMAWNKRVKGFRPDPLRSWSGGVFRIWQPPAVQVYLER